MQQNERPADPPELVPAIEALQQGRFEQTLTLAMPYVEAEMEQTKIDARRLCGLALSRLGRYQEALPHWVRLAHLENTAFNALQVATSSIMCNQLNEGKAWFAKADELNKVSEEMSPVTLRTNFITSLTNRGYFQDAFEYVEWLKKIYQQFGITDPTFLHIRGVPFFSAFLENTASIVSSVMSPEEVRGWYASLREHVDDEGKESIDQFLQQA